MSVGRDFGLAHGEYRRYRPDYPEALYARIFAGLPGRGLAIDLGAGTGLVSARLRRDFERVIAVEPDAAMAAHLREQVPEAELVLAPVERAELPAGAADLLCCANAFHWMDGPRALDAIARWLRPGGVFAGWRYPFPRLPHRLQALIAREMQARWAPFLDPRSLDAESMPRHVREHAGFELKVAEELANPVPMDVRGVLGFVRSTSFGAAFLRSLDEASRAAYLEQLEAEIAAGFEGPTVELDLRLSLVLATTASR